MLWLVCFIWKIQKLRKHPWTIKKNIFWNQRKNWTVILVVYSISISKYVLEKKVVFFFISGEQTLNICHQLKFPYHKKKSFQNILLPNSSLIHDVLWCTYMSPRRPQNCKFLRKLPRYLGRYIYHIQLSKHWI